MVSCRCGTIACNGEKCNGIAFALSVANATISRLKAELKKHVGDDRDKCHIEQHVWQLTSSRQALWGYTENSYACTTCTMKKVEPVMSRHFVRKVITKAEYYEAYKKLTGMEQLAMTDEAFAECQTPEFEDDWVRPITEEEYDLRFTRVGGDVVCFTCGQLYYDHPNEQRLYPEGYDKQLCNGWIGHT